jgi:hypothetical protein
MANHRHYDFGLKLEGPAAALEPAIKEITLIGKKWNENVRKPEIHDDDDHALLWFYQKGIPVTLESALFDLTKHRPFFVWLDISTTDGGRNAAWLRKFEKGAVSVSVEWHAPIEIEEAVACLGFRAVPNAKDLATLSERIKLAWNAGWEGDDHPGLAAAAELAREIYRGLASAPDFTDEPATKEMLAKLLEPLAVVAKDLKPLSGASDEDLREILGLLAIIEAQELGAVAGPAKKTKRRPPF